MMSTSREHCSVSVTWDCRNDPSYLASYSIVQPQDVNTWFQEYSATTDDSLDNACLLCSQPAGHSEPFELTCECKPHHALCLLGAVIVSESRILECYTQTDGYLNSFRGKEVGYVRSDGADGEKTNTDRKLYQTLVKFDGQLKSFSLKFLGLGEKTILTITRLEFILTVDDERGPHVGSIDMSKVKTYLRSMGDSTPAGAMDLFQSVEQFQKTQGMGLAGLSSIFGSQPPGKTSSNRLTGLLAMMASANSMSSSCDSGIANDNSSQRSCDTGITNEKNGQNTCEGGIANENSAQKPCDNGSANENVNTTHQSSMPGSLQTLMMSMLGTRSTDSNQDGSQDKDSMYNMLKGICGRVSELRVNEVEGTPDIEPQESLEPDSTDQEGPVIGGDISVSAMKAMFEQTATELVQQSEQRLKDYIDTRLNDMENRIYNKLDSMMQVLQKNGHPNDIS